MADEAKTTNTAAQAGDANRTAAPEAARVKTDTDAPKVAETGGKGRARAEKARYETTGEFQLFDASTNITVPHDGSAELYSNSNFVINGLKTKKLKKVG